MCRLVRAAALNYVETVNYVETLHCVETTHVWRVFCFRRTKSFHVNGRPGLGGLAAAQHTVLKGTALPLSLRIVGY